MRGNSEIIESVKVLLAQGGSGASISTITKTSSSGAVDTYTITLTDGRTSTFQVTNGTPIQSVVLTSSTNVYDTYTITDTAGNTSTFQVKNHDKDLSDFENEVNAILSNTPYMLAIEGDSIEIPVNTINDNNVSVLSTYSSYKIQEMFDNMAFTPAYTPAVNPSAIGSTNKGTLSGGVFTLGKFNVVALKLSLTASITKSNYTSVAALVPRGNLYLCPLSGYYDATNEKRYHVIASVIDGDSYGRLNFSCPDIDLPNGADIYFGGCYIGA